jgi:hypothetical protein
LLCPAAHGGIDPRHVIGILIDGFGDRGSRRVIEGRFIQILKREIDGSSSAGREKRRKKRAEQSCNA